MENGKTRGTIAPTEETVSKTPMNSILTGRQNDLLYVALHQEVKNRVYNLIVWTHVSFL